MSVLSDGIGSKEPYTIYNRIQMTVLASGFKYFSE
nr:MAG TPA: hypothetical protein [Caudoviricetes sp.]